MNGVAHVHPQATLRPSKVELLAAWLPSQTWFRGDPRHLERLASFRFVDPTGEVGLDSMLLAVGESVWHVPVTWRAEPLTGGTLIGVLEHSVLGTRYCYDAPSDPVYVAEVERVIRDADTNADVRAEGSAGFQPRVVDVMGSGVDIGQKVEGDVEIVRLLNGISPDGAARLVATWQDEGRGRTDVLAVLR